MVNGCDVGFMRSLFAFCAFSLLPLAYRQEWRQAKRLRRDLINYVTDALSSLPQASGCKAANGMREVPRRWCAPALALRAWSDARTVCSLCWAACGWIFSTAGCESLCLRRYILNNRNTTESLFCWGVNVEILLC